MAEVGQSSVGHDGKPDRRMTHLLSQLGYICPGRICASKLASFAKKRKKNQELPVLEIWFRYFCDLQECVRAAQEILEWKYPSKTYRSNFSPKSAYFM